MASPNPPAPPLRRSPSPPSGAPGVEDIASRLAVALREPGSERASRGGRARGSPRPRAGRPPQAPLGPRHVFVSASASRVPHAFQVLFSPRPPRRPAPATDYTPVQPPSFPHARNRAGISLWKGRRALFALRVSWARSTVRRSVSRTAPCSLPGRWPPARSWSWSWTNALTPPFFFIAGTSARPEGTPVNPPATDRPRHAPAGRE